jgi:hypothetical protein
LTFVGRFRKLELMEATDRRAAAAYVDTRPRVAYRLRDGSEVAVIFDHGDLIPFEVTFQLPGGSVTLIQIVDSSLAGTVAA